MLLRSQGTPSFWLPTPSCGEGWFPSLEVGISALSGLINLDCVGMFADSLVIFVVNTKGGAHSAIINHERFPTSCINKFKTKTRSLQHTLEYSALYMRSCIQHIMCKFRWLRNSRSTTFFESSLHQYILSTALCLTPPQFEVKLWYPTRYNTHFCVAPHK